MEQSFQNRPAIFILIKNNGLGSLSKYGRRRRRRLDLLPANSPSEETAPMIRSTGMCVLECCHSIGAFLASAGVNVRATRGVFDVAIVRPAVCGLKKSYVFTAVNIA